MNYKDKGYYVENEQSRVLSEIIRINPFWNVDWNEMSMAGLFTKIHRLNALYCPEARSWFIYDGTRWKRDTDGLETMGKLMKFVKLLMTYSDEIDDSQRRIGYGSIIDYRQFLMRLADRRARLRIIKDAQISGCVNITYIDQINMDKLGGIEHE